jgi:Fic family protein
VKRSLARGSYVRQTWTADPTIYAPARHRRPCSYDAFVPEPVAHLDLSLPGPVAGVVSDARLLLRTESIASSKVEGMQLDARSLARAEANQETGRKVGSDAAEILANIDAMQLSIERASTSDRIRRRDLTDIHQVLLAHAPNAHIAGRVRTSQNWIGGNDYTPCGATFVPPPPDDVARLLRDLCAFVNESTLPPLVQAAVAHAQFETIHPFDDGNGRTGRALVQVILRRRGLAPAFVPPISVVLAADKDRYIRGLTRFREDGLDEWIEVFATATARAAQLAARYAERVATLQLRSDVGPRSDSAAWRLISVLPAHPVISIAVGAAVTGRTRPAVANAITDLEAAGVLIPLSQAARNRAWEAAGLLDLIVGLEAGVG